MFSVSVTGGGDRLAPYLRRCLKKASREGTIDAALCSGTQADLRIITEGEAAPGCLLLRLGAEGRTLRCGLGYGDDLTLSSIRRGSAMLALQQEVPALSGAALEQQEIPVTIGAPAEPEAVLAAAGAMLLLGADASGGLRLP